MAFPETINAELDQKIKKWSVIEVIKNGEVKRMVNYLICHKRRKAKIIAYRYHQGGWLKVAQWQKGVKMSRLVREKSESPFKSRL